MDAFRKLALPFQSGLIEMSVPKKLNVDTWYDARDPFGTGVLPGDTDPVTSIVDLGFRGNNLSQSAAPAPTYLVNAFNGKPGFSFGGTQNLVRVSSSSNNYVGAMTIIAVAITTSTANVARLINKGSFNAGAGGGWGAGRSTSAYRYTSYTHKDYDSAASQWTSGTVQITTQRLNADRSVSFFKNGVAAGSSSAPASMPANSIDSLLFGGGTIDATDQFWRGSILALFWFWRALTSNELTMIHNYCKSVWGIT